MEQPYQVIEINGVKLEVDLRHARRVDQLRVGDRVKVLVKNYTDYKVHAGTIIGFEPFNHLPTIIVAYLDIDYSGTNVKFVHFNSNSKEVEIVKAVDDDQLDISKRDICAWFDRETAKKEQEISELREKKSFFLEKFGAYWNVDAPAAAEDA